MLLSLTEHGAYRLLIDHYMMTEKPLPDDDQALARIIGATPKEWARITMVIRAFFVPENGMLRHKRCDEELARQKDKTRGGQMSAGRRWGSDLDKQNRHTRSERLSRARDKGTHTAAEWEALIAVFDGRCVKCGANGHRPVKDHIIPIYQGGSDSIENLQPLCRTCNASKGPDTTDYRYENNPGWKTGIQRFTHDG